MTVDIVSRVPHPTAIIRVPAAPAAPADERPQTGRHRATCTGSNVRELDLVIAAQIEPRRRTRHAVAPVFPLPTGRAAALFWVALGAITGAAVACCVVLATPDTAAAVAGSAVFAVSSPLERLRRLLRGEQVHVPGCPRAHLLGPCPVEIEVFDPRDYALVVTMSVGTLEVRVQHQGVNDEQADRLMARLAAEVIDEIGDAPVRRELLLLDVQRAHEDKTQ